MPAQLLTTSDIMVDLILWLLTAVSLYIVARVVMDALPLIRRYFDRHHGVHAHHRE